MMEGRQGFGWTVEGGNESLVDRFLSKLQTTNGINEKCEKMGIT